MISISISVSLRKSFGRQRFLVKNGFIDSWKGHYVTSNTVSASPDAVGPGRQIGDPLGTRYLRLTGEFGRSILVFGFLSKFYLTLRY